MKLLEETQAKNQPKPFYDTLWCPFCHSPLQAASSRLDYAVLRCGCGRYPVIAGIPILKKGAIGIAGETADDLAALIEADRQPEALAAVLLPDPPSLSPAWVEQLPRIRGTWRLKNWLHQRAARQLMTMAAAPSRQNQTVTASECLRLYFGSSGAQPGEDYNYLFFRFGQPRHLVALSFATLLHAADKPMLDVGCGCGHITRHLVQQATGQPIIGLDRNFFCLYIAKHWIAPEADFICSDAEWGLPFPDGALSAALCSDAFHYFLNKQFTVRELKRVLAETGVILLVSMSNALVPQFDRCHALSPLAYGDLLGDLPHRVVSDHAVLDRYLLGKGPSLAHPGGRQQLEQALYVSVVASYQKDLFRDHESFGMWPHAQGRLDLNPLYRAVGRAHVGRRVLRRTFPSAFYREQNFECKQYLPVSVEVSEHLWDDLAKGRHTPEIDELVAQCVLLDVPLRYR